MSYSMITLMWEESIRMNRIEVTVEKGIWDRSLRCMNMKLDWIPRVAMIVNYQGKAKGICTEARNSFKESIAN